MIVTYGCKLVAFVDMFQTVKCGTNGASVANDTTVHWKEREQLRFGAMDDLFSSYSNSE